LPNATSSHLIFCHLIITTINIGTGNTLIGLQYANPKLRSVRSHADPKRHMQSTKEMTKEIKYVVSNNLVYGLLQQAWE